MKTVLAKTILAILLVVLIGSCGQQQTLLSVAAGPSGGTWHPIGGMIGNIVNRYVDGVRVNVESTEGGV
ncbi:MAG: C4-dicarboxylate ABC transporter substrate-binding protein, partial [Acidobacteriota bacterium]